MERAESCGEAPEDRQRRRVAAALIRPGPVSCHMSNPLIPGVITMSRDSGFRLVLQFFQLLTVKKTCMFSFSFMFFSFVSYPDG